MTQQAAPVRSVTIDRARHRRIVRDLTLETARVRPAGWWLGVALAGVVVLAVSGHSVVAALVVAMVLAALQLLVWWLQAARRSQDGLATGQTVSTQWAPDGELVVTDATGEFHLQRGSVAMLRRTGGNANVYGRSVRMVLPGELLTDDDAAFLEGHAPAPAPLDAQHVAPNDPQPQAPHEAPHDELPLSLVVTEEVQARMLSDATRTVVLSADFLFFIVVALPLAVFGLVTPLWGLLVVAAFMLVLSLPDVVRLLRWRAAYRRAFPVGRTLRAGVTPDHLAVTMLHGTAFLTWDNFDRLSATDHNVLLRHRRRVFGPSVHTVLPLGLFTPADIHQLAACVPRRR